MKPTNELPDWSIEDQRGYHPEKNGEEGDLPQVLVPEEIQEGNSTTLSATER